MNPLSDTIKDMKLAPMREVSKTLQIRWYHCPVDKKILRSLMSPDDRRGLFLALGHDQFRVRHSRPDRQADLIDRDGDAGRYFQTIEHGTYGGRLMDGDLLGYAMNPSCMIDGPSQFDFYSGGGLDIAFLGFGELDASGNVNVSKLAGNTVGPGGFIDIVQNARKVVFCGTFDTGGARPETGDGRLRVTAQGGLPNLSRRSTRSLFPVRKHAFRASISFM